MMSITEAARTLSERCEELAAMLPAPVSIVYNPLQYAWDVHLDYLTNYGGSGAKTVVLGMNPGPWGMGQTGVPFGDVDKVRDYLGLTGEVRQPPSIHPKRPVHGLSTSRNEVSGTRLWGIIEEVLGDARSAHSHIFVVNHCPLLMFDERGGNLTPEKLRGSVARELMAECDLHLGRVVEALGASRIIGVGAYAEKQAKIAVAGRGIEVLRVPHPSPASPLANRNGGADWRRAVGSVLSSICGAE